MTTAISAANNIQSVSTGQNKNRKKKAECVGAVIGAGIGAGVGGPVLIKKFPMPNGFYTKLATAKLEKMLGIRGANKEVVRLEAQKIANNLCKCAIGAGIGVGIGVVVASLIANSKEKNNANLNETA